MGTMLQGFGLAIGEASDLWNLSHPDVVAAVARSYGEAGSRIVLSNTFQANPIALDALGAGDRWVEVNREGIALARSGAPGVAVFGSIGPIGRATREASVAFLAQAKVLAEAGAEAIVLETFGNLDEALIALQGARKTGLPVIVSLSFQADGTVGGRSPEDVGRRLEDAGADAVGANCGDGPAPFADLCRRLRAGSGLPVWIKPNAGTPILRDGQAVYPMTPRAFGAYWPVFVAAGAAFVGGCCGAGPAFLRALAEARDSATGSTA